MLTVKLPLCCTVRVWSVVTVFCLSESSDFKLLMFLNTLCILLFDCFWWGALPYKTIMWCQCLGCYPNFIWLSCSPEEAFCPDRVALPSFQLYGFNSFSLLFLYFPHPATPVLSSLATQVNFDLSSLSCSPEATFLAGFFSDILPQYLSIVCFYYSWCVCVCVCFI